MAKLRILVVDNSVMGTQLLSDALARERRFTVLRPSTERLDPALLGEVDVAVISANLHGRATGGCELAKQLRSDHPQIRSVLLIENRTRKTVVDSFRAGARGVFYRNDSVEALPKCIHAVYNGQIWANQAELTFVFEALNDPVPMRLVDAKGATLLSGREQDVVRWAAEGLTNREIADRLGLSEHTVKNYLFRIFDKLGVSNRIELILYAITQLSPAAAQPTPPPRPASDDEAMLKLCNAAVKSCSVAPYELAQSYRQGRGVPADLGMALMWYIIAESISGRILQESKAGQAEIRARLNAQEVMEAERRAAEWLERQALTEGRGNDDRMQVIKGGSKNNTRVPAA